MLQNEKFLYVVISEEYSKNSNLQKDLTYLHQRGKMCPFNILEMQSHLGAVCSCRTGIIKYF